MLKGRSNTPVIGIDLSDNQLRFVEAKGTAASPIILHHGSAPFETPFFLDGVLEDVAGFSDFATSLLSKCFAQNIAVCLDDEDVQTLTLTLEKNLSEEDLEDNLAIELERKLSFPLEEAYFDYAVIGPNLEDDNLLDYAVVATKSLIVDGLSNCFAGLGYELKLVSYRAAVLGNFLQQVMQQKQLTETCGLLFNNQTSMELLIATPEKLLFNETLNHTEAEHQDNDQSLLDLAQSELGNTPLQTLFTLAVDSNPTSSLLDKTQIIALDPLAQCQTENKPEPAVAYTLAVALAMEGLRT